MVMAVKPVDIKQSYIPGDPNAIAPNLEFTRAEDDPRAPIPITPFEGYNFLPTDYGYRSYFGLNALLNIPALVSRCDEVFIFKATNLTVKAIALCEDGIWSKDASTASGSWIQELVFIKANLVPVIVTIEGSSSPPVTETSTLTFTSLEIGQTVTVAGKTYTATAFSTAADVATAITGGVSPNGTVTGALVDWTDNLDSPGIVTYTSTTPNTNVTNIVVTVTTPFANSYDPLIHRKWTFLRIANKSYFYNKGRDTINVMDDDLVFTTIAPNFITMSGQVGMFQAGGRIGMWDNLDAIANSSVFDFSDFVPSLETLANVTTFRDVIGMIVTILKHGDGFIIYATESITSVRLNLAQTGLLWQAIPVSKTKGIKHAGEVALGATSQEHYVYTTEGLIVIKDFNAFIRKHDIEASLTPVIDFLREDNEIVQLKVLQSRYIFFNLVNLNYINGITHTFETTSSAQGAVEVTYRDDTAVTFRDDSHVLFRGSVSFPSTVFNIASGITLPIYPTFKGSLVWDIQLKKWGKFKGDFRLLMELTPSNTFDPETVGFTTFGMNVGALKNDGTIRIFDSKPSDSFCRWGKYGLSRLGMTTLLEVEALFRSNSTGFLEVESSLNDRDFNQLLSLSTPFNDTRSIVHRSDYNGRWHAIALRGQWDLQHMAIAGKISSKR